MNDDFKVFTGNANPELARKVCEYLGISLGDIEVGRFADGEIKVIINENVRGKNVYLIQSTPPPSDNYMELFIVLDALKRASAENICAITHGKSDCCLRRHKICGNRSSCRTNTRIL